MDNDKMKNLFALLLNNGYSPEVMKQNYPELQSLTGTDSTPQDFASDHLGIFSSPTSLKEDGTPMYPAANSFYNFNNANPEDHYTNEVLNYYLNDINSEDELKGLANYMTGTDIANGDLTDEDLLNLLKYKFNKNLGGR